MNSIVSNTSIRLGDLTRLVATRHGWFLANANDHYIGNALIKYGEYGEIESQFLRTLVHPGDVVVEVGANIGTHTVPLARCVGNTGKVVAIEAQQVIHQFLCGNIASNAITNVTTYCLGCGATRELMHVPRIDYLAKSAQNFGGVSLERSGDGDVVEIVPLDELVGHLPKLNLIKIDVEGMEADVIHGARELISKFRPALYLENDRVEKSQALIDLMFQLNYRLWWHIPALFNPKNYFGESTNIYGNAASFNMLGLPNESPVKVSGLSPVADSTFHPLAKKLSPPLS